MLRINQFRALVMLKCGIFKASQNSHIKIPRYRCACYLNIIQINERKSIFAGCENLGFRRFGHTQYFIWDLTPCTLIDVYLRFRETRCLHHHSRLKTTLCFPTRDIRPKFRHLAIYISTGGS